MFQFQRQRNNIEKTQNMWKSHSVFQENDLLISNFISCFLYVFNDLKCYECTKLRCTLIIGILEVKEQHRKIMKKMKVLSFKMSIRQTLTSFLAIIFSSFCVFFEQFKTILIMPNQGLKIPCAFESYKDNVLGPKAM